MFSFGLRVRCGWGNAVTTSMLVLRYVAFAMIATFTNLATQRAILMVGQSAGHFAAAVLSGTFVGLLVKFSLDKRWIFFDTGGGVRANSRKFTAYSVIGLATTVIFWGMETLFWVVWQTNAMREVGAVIGLSIGYVVKYQLDRRFVFSVRTAREER